MQILFNFCDFHNTKSGNYECCKGRGGMSRVRGGGGEHSSYCSWGTAQQLCRNCLATFKWCLTHNAKNSCIKHVNNVNNALWITSALQYSTRCEKGVKSGGRGRGLLCNLKVLTKYLLDVSSCHCLAYEYIAYFLELGFMWSKNRSRTSSANRSITKSRADQKQSS